MRSKLSLLIQENITEEELETLIDYQEGLQNNSNIPSKKPSNKDLMNSNRERNNQNSSKNGVKLTNDQSKTTVKESRGGVMSFLKSNQSIEELSDQKPNIAENILFDESE